MVIPEFLKRIKHRINDEWRKHLYRNLVFKGGGVRGIAYMGALTLMDELGMLEGIRRVAGTSAGAIAAMLVSFGLSIPETKRVFSSLDTTRVPQHTDSTQKRKFWQPADLECYVRLFNNYGWHSSQYLHQWFENVIAEQCQGNGRATFAEFQARGFRELSIVATNVSRHRAEVFSATNSPDIAVADAVRMSMSIPLYFEALRFDGKEFGDGDFYVDGGLYDNFPMHIFDHPDFVYKNWAYRDGINWETLGLFLYPAQLKNQNEPEYPANIWEFVNLTMKNVYYTQQSAGIDTNTADRHRTIEISDCGVKPTEFDIIPGNEKYVRLFDAGQAAVRTFFELDAETKPSQA